MQLVLQANSLAGYMSVSTFPGADKVNSSLWIGGDGSKAGGTQQWLPYLTNGNGGGKSFFTKMFLFSLFIEVM